MKRLSKKEIKSIKHTFDIICKIERSLDESKVPEYHWLNEQDNKDIKISIKCAIGGFINKNINPTKNLLMGLISDEIKDEDKD